MDEALSPLEEFCRIMQRHGVEFVVIGGQAETLHGSPRVTYDTDLCYRRSPENLRRLEAALAELHPRLRGAPADLPFRADARTLEMGSNFTFETDLGPLDLLGHVEPLGDYEQVAAGAESYPLNGVETPTMSVRDLIRVKEHIKRAKDQESLVQLRAIQRVRDAQSGGAA